MWKKIVRFFNESCYIFEMRRLAEIRDRTKYSGTRIIEVALKLYEDRGYNKHRLFWYLPKYSRNLFYKEAIQQLHNNSFCWGPMYKWIRRFQKTLLPLAWFLEKINNIQSLPFRLHATLYKLSHNLSWETGNWNIVPEKEL